MTFLEYLTEKRSDDLKKAEQHTKAFFEHIGSLYTCEEISNWDTTVSNTYNIIYDLTSQHINTAEFLTQYLTNNFDKIEKFTTKKISRYNQQSELNKEQFIEFVKGLLDRNPTHGSIVKAYAEEKLTIQCQDLSTKKKKSR